MPHTTDDIKRWIHDHVERRANPPLVETIGEILERTKDDVPLQKRVKGFLHGIDQFAVPLADQLDDSLQRLWVYHLVKGWASVVVGWDAPNSEYVEDGFDLLMDYAITRLKVG